MCLFVMLFDGKNITKCFFKIDVIHEMNCTIVVTYKQGMTILQISSYDSNPEEFEVQVDRDDPIKSTEQSIKITIKVSVEV